MNKPLLKFAIVIMPIFAWWSSGWIIGSMTASFLFSKVSHNIDSGNGYNIVMASMSPIIGFVILGIMIYVSIKLWIKYIK